MHRTFPPSFAFAPQSATQSVPQATGLGSMPEWDLSDLYKAPDAPEVQRDLKAAAKEATRIKSAYQGRLADLAKDGGKLAGAIKDYEKLSDLVGKLGSYAGLYYVLNQTDPARAKFNGDVSEALTKLYTDLIFFELELNQIDDETIEAATKHEERQALQAVARRSAQGKAASARRKARNALHREIADEPRRLEPALQRNDVGAEVRGQRRKGRRCRLELTLNFLSDPDEKKRKAAVRSLEQGVQGQSAALHADHEHAGQGQGDFRPLAQLQGRRRQPQSRQPRRSPGRRCAGVERARRLSAAVASLLRDEGQVARQEEARVLGSQRAASRQARAHRSAGPRPRRSCCVPTATSRRRWRRSPSSSSTRTGSTRR